MNLRDGVVMVRDRLGEGSPWFFDTNSIIRDLNHSARALCSNAQSLRETYASVTALDPLAGSGVYSQEYMLPADLEYAYNGRIQIGIPYPLDFRTQEELQLGAFTPSAPFRAYVRFGRQKSQQIPGGAIQIETPPASKVGTAHWWIGFWPVPAAAYNFWVNYIAYHPWMADPMSPLCLPDTGEWADIWVAYAVARGKEKEGDLVAAAALDAKFNAGMEAYKNYMLKSMSAIIRPRWGGTQMAPGPSVVILAPTASQLSIE